MEQSHPFMRVLGIAPAERRVRRYRDISLYPLCVGHLRLLDLVLPEGFRPDSERDCACAAILLSSLPSRALKAVLRGKLPPHRGSVLPRDAAERAAVAEALAEPWRVPARWRDADELARAPKPNEGEYASPPWLRLSMRLARIPNLAALTGGAPVDDIPVADALALLMAADEADGAHYMSPATAARLEGNP